MKFLTVFVATLALAAAMTAQQSKEQLQEHTAQCVQQEGITKEQAEAVKSGIFTDTDPKVKCFANCMLEKIDVMVNGELKPEKVIDHMGEMLGVDNIKATLEKCKDLQGTDKCELAFKFFECFDKNRGSQS